MTAMTDTATEPTERTPEEQAAFDEALQRAQIEATFNSAPVLPVRWTTQSGEVEGQPIVLLTVETPATRQRLVLSRDQALEMASMLRKQAQTGPQIVAAPAGLIIPR